MIFLDVEEIVDNSELQTKIAIKSIQRADALVLKIDDIDFLKIFMFYFT
jgi:hypothetical protein